jgi:proton-dependent oligopeptide transporter, POT family
VFSSNSSTKHPPEMILLALVEMCQRFCFWGVGNLLVLYLLQHHGMSDTTADQVFAIFTGSALILPLFGGYVADRWNYQHAVIWGCILTAIGCFFIATNIIALVYLALIFVAIGGCIFTPSIYALLGAVYHDRHQLREAGFSIYYASVNIGVFAALIIMGAIGNANHWSAAFIIAGIVQIIGLIPLRAALSMKKLQRVSAEGKSSFSFRSEGPPLLKRDKQRITVICILSLVSILFWMSYNQGGSSLTIFALKYTQRQIGNFTMPPAWLLSFETLFLIVLAVPLASLYIHLAKKNKDPSPPMKTAFSLIAMGLCFLIMVYGTRLIPEGAMTAAISPWYLICSYLLMAVGEMLLAPIGLALVTHLSPPRFTAFLVGVWYLCIGIAFYSGGIIATLMSSVQNMGNFFLIFVIATIIPAFLLMFFAKKLNKMRNL